MNFYRLSLAFVQTTVACTLAYSASPTTSLIPDKPILLSGEPSRFDFMSADPIQRRILAAHTGASTLEMVDLKTGKAMPPIHVGDAQGVAVDSEGKRYFLGNRESKSVVTISSEDFKKLSEVKVDGEVDAIAFDRKNGFVYASKDDGDILWVVDPKIGKVVQTIAIPGVPEVLEYDSKTDRIYLNIKDKDLVAVIDPQSQKVIARWPTAPATSPHGLALDTKRGRIFVAGKNGKLLSMSMTNGQILSSVEIPAGVDQIGFEPETRMIYSACKGAIGVSQDQDSGLRTLPSVESPKGAHTLAVLDGVWVSYADASHSYLQRFRISSSSK